MAERVSTGKAAAALGVNRRNLQRWAKREGFPTAPGEDHDLDALRAWAEKEGLLGRTQGEKPSAVDLVQSASPPASPPGVAQLSTDDRQALEILVGGDPEKLIHLAANVRPELLKRLAAMGKTRRELAEAERRETENKRVRGDLVQVDDVRRWWAGHVQAAKSILQALPGKLAPELSGRSVPYDAVYSSIERELEAALSGLARAAFGG